MKKIIVMLMAVVMLLTMFGCSKKEESGSQLDKIKEAGKIIVAMEGTWAPWTYHDEEDNLVGYDTEVAQKIAEKLGVEVEFVEGEWDGLFAGLDAGRYDIIVNGVDITEERSEKYDFTDAYAYNRTALIVKGDNEEIQTFEDLNGKTTANTLSSSYAALSESYGATTKGVDTLEQTIELVLNGHVDATLNAEVSYYDYLEVHPDADLKIATFTEDTTHVAIPIRKGEDELREAINKALAELAEEGVLTELSEKYFNVDISSNN